MQDDLRRNLIAYVFANMADAVCITAKNGGIHYVNSSAEKLFGFGESSSGRKIWEVIPFTEKNDSLVQLFLDAVSQRIDVRSLVDYETNDGKLFKLHVSVTYMTENDGIFVVVIRDLTELFRVNSAFKRYTSSAIADYVLNTPDGEKQGGTTRDVTILMSDLRGFTAMSTKLPPDTLITILNHYFEHMVAVIERWKGTVIEFLGDGIFVVFGAPAEDSDHAVHAVSCALEMENAMKAVNEWNVSNGYPALEMGIGINSGPAVVGNIGSAQKMKYGCMGETVNLAGRVETFTIGGQVYISERTKALLKEGDNLTVSGTQSFMPKGAKSPMEIFAVEGIGSIHMAGHGAVKWRECSGAVKFRKAEGKIISDDEFSGQVVKLSEDERYAVMESEAELEAMQNVMMEIGGSLYGKVMERKGKASTICFTSKPDTFASWVSSLL